MSALKVCPSCGAEYPANERFCPRDGSALRALDSDATNLVGSIIAERYHVLKKLGEGGMGQVYLAEHVKMGRKSAVKVMNPGMVHDSDAISRFNREASNASRINHPNVAGIYDFGETSDGLIYLAMEFIEGQALTDLVKSQGALPPERAAKIIQQTGEGLAVAHDMGIVHRDLKPDNIMIAKNRDGSDCVKVVDFGIAKAANAAEQKVTKTGLVVGTPEYMSPEQLVGEKLDGRSDVYSLGLVAFNTLTGALPFPSDTVQEAMIMRLTDKPKPLRELNPAIAWPAKVQAVMDKALERDVNLRFQSASEFGQTLYEAIMEMPAAMRQASAPAAAGTMVFGGATTPMPATRIEQGNVSKDGAAVVAAKSRMPMLVGGGALVVAAVAAAMVFMPHGAPAGAGATTQAPAASAPAVTPASTGPAASVPAANLPASPAVQRTASSTSGPVTPSGSAAASPPRTASGGNFGAVLDSLDKLAEESATARRALTRLDAVEGRAETVAQRARVAIIRAQAYGSLSEDAAACRVLKAAVPDADPESARRMKVMLESCP